MVDSFVFEINHESEISLKEACVGFVIAELNCLNPFYRMVIVVLALLFNYSALPSTHRIFVKLPVQERLQVIGRWQAGKFKFQRKFIKLIQNLSLLAFYDQEAVLEKFSLNLEQYRQALAFYTGNSNE